MSLFPSIEKTIKSTLFPAMVNHLLAQDGVNYIVNTVSVGAPVISKITCLGDVSGSLNNKYFLLNAVSGAQYYVWFNVSYLGTDPLVANRIPIEVDINTNDANTVVALALSEVLGNQDFQITLTNQVVTVQDRTSGAITALQDVNTGFGFSTVQAGKDPNSQSEYYDVYGMGGSETDKYDCQINVKGIVTGDDFIPVDNSDAGTFTRGFLYANDSRLKPGYILNIDRGMGINRRYTLGFDMSLGTNTSIPIRWTLEAIND